MLFCVLHFRPGPMQIFKIARHEYCSTNIKWQDDYSPPSHVCY
jgi:hypothetical protein